MKITRYTVSSLALFSALVVFHPAAAQQVPQVAATNAVDNWPRIQEKFNQFSGTDGILSFDEFKEWRRETSGQDLSQEKINIMRENFLNADTNGDGVLTGDEVRHRKEIAEVGPRFEGLSESDIDGLAQDVPDNVGAAAAGITKRERMIKFLEEHPQARDALKNHPNKREALKEFLGKHPDAKGALAAQERRAEKAKEILKENPEKAAEIRKRLGETAAEAREQSEAEGKQKKAPESLGRFKEDHKEGGARLGGRLSNKDGERRMPVREGDKPRLGKRLGDHNEGGVLNKTRIQKERIQKERLQKERISR